MARELIVIPKEGETSKKYQRSNVGVTHHDNLVNYIVQNHINVDLFLDPFIYTLALEMTYLNYVVIGVDGEEFCVYLPPELTKAQAKWFDDRKLSISNLDVLVVSVNEKENDEYEIEQIEGYMNGISPVDNLYKKIKEKTFNYENEKVKIYGNK